MLKRIVARWPLVLIFMLCTGIPLAWAATDAYFAGRAIRMTKTAAATCTDANHNCKWFDTSSRERFWNGTTSLYTTNSTESTPTKGKILVGNGTNWVSLAAGSNGQVLATDTTDGGLPTGLRWEASGGLSDPLTLANPIKFSADGKGLQSASNSGKIFTDDNTGTVIQYGGAYLYIGGSGDATLIGGGGIRTVGSATHPTCNSGNRGLQYYVTSASLTADQVEMCMKKADDSYAWVVVKAAP